jgi:membrane peptidoglycan carboxypeptidase
MNAEKILQSLQSVTGEKWNIEEDGLTITTTLNLTLQEYALESFRRTSLSNAEKNKGAISDSIGQKFY